MCAGAPGAAETLKRPAGERPNVVLVVIDDLGWMDLGCQGSSFYETPGIDRMAREGTRFTNAYANASVCSPSRAALMTGRYPGRVGFTGHITSTGRHRRPPDARKLPPDDYLFRGIPGNGRHSAGEVPQYCGQLGRKESCQVAV